MEENKIKPLRTKKVYQEKEKGPRGRKQKPIDEQLRTFINKKIPEEEDYLYDSEVIDIKDKIIEPKQQVNEVKPIKTEVEIPKTIVKTEVENLKPIKSQEDNIKELVAQTMIEIYNKQKEEENKLREQERLERKKQLEEQTNLVKTIANREEQNKQKYLLSLRKLRGQLFV